MTKTPSDRKKSSRQARLEQALRANLARRKVQARARRQSEAETAEQDAAPVEHTKADDASTASEPGQGGSTASRPGEGGKEG
ncbi:hypothetical protein E3C22_09555 [Jiella endophytica]|uniref:DUF4169 family protein n=1 Tax=Jiella endophytica TaxID=2558362 RepID=A0A4Y8RPN4_9HYPH|nr:hypothetical protein [Jiella endophytica]TFF25578.1 hypothetical protein E3C22_09555 [Jiella endophytica]